MELQTKNIILIKNTFERETIVEENQKVTVKVSIGVPDTITEKENPCPINIDILSTDGATGKKEMFKIRLEYMLGFDLDKKYLESPKSEIIDNIMDQVEEEIKRQIDSILNYAGLTELNVSLKRKK